MNANEKKKVVGFYGLIEFGDYLNRLNGSEHTFEMKDDAGQLVNCSRDDVVRQYQDFCGSDSGEFRVRITWVDSKTGAKRHFDKILRRSSRDSAKPPIARLVNGLGKWFGGKRAQ